MEVWQCSTHRTHNIYTKPWQSSTRRKCETEEVHLYKIDEKSNIYERCQ